MFPTVISVAAIFTTLRFSDTRSTDSKPKELPSDFVFAVLSDTQQILKKYSKTPTIILKHDFIKPRKGDPTGEVQIYGEESQKQWEIFKEYDQITNHLVPESIMALWYLKIRRNFYLTVSFINYN